jgi:hypothetical protein
MATDFDVKQLDKQVTLKVHIHLTKEWHFRKALAIFFIRLATRILGCGLEVES